MLLFQTWRWFDTNLSDVSALVSCARQVEAARAGLVQAMLAVTIVSCACSSLEPGSDFFGLDAGVSARSLAPALSFGDGGADRTSPIAGCSPIAERPTMRLGEPGQVAELASDTRWTCANNYLLQAPLSVRAGATLRVGPDTYVAASPSALPR